MKFHRLVITLATFLPALTQAQDFSDSHLAAAEELLTVTRVAEVTDSAIDTMLKAQINAAPALANYQDILREFLQENVSWNAVKEDVTRMYAESFTESELRELIEFNQTPVGQKSVRLMPELMEKGAALGQQRVQAKLPDLQN